LKVGSATAVFAADVFFDLVALEHPATDPAPASTAAPAAPAINCRLSNFGPAISNSLC